MVADSAAGVERVLIKSVVNENVNITTALFLRALCLSTACDFLFMPEAKTPLYFDCLHSFMVYYAF